MKFLGWVFLIIFVASSLALFACSDSTTLTRPQPSYNADDIGPTEG